jgi:Domain of unknown function (DUF1707)
MAPVGGVSPAGDPQDLAGTSLKGPGSRWVRSRGHTEGSGGVPPMTDRPIRASDQERESVVAVLRDAYVDGRLTLEEFEERSSAGYAAKTWTELRELTADLPVEPLFGADLSHRPQAIPPPAVPPARRPHQARRDRPFGHLLPILFVWILVEAAAGSPDMAAALSFVFICLLACRAGYGGR